MNELDPHVVASMSAGVVAAAMVVLGRKKRMLRQPDEKRCVACGRRLEPRGTCPRCG